MAKARTWLTMAGFWEGYLKPLLPSSKIDRKGRKEGRKASAGLGHRLRPGLSPVGSEPIPVGSKEGILYYGFLEAIRSQAKRRFRKGSKGAFQAIVREKLKEAYASWLRIYGSLPFSLEEVTQEALGILGEAWRMASYSETKGEAEAESIGEDEAKKEAKDYSRNEGLKDKGRRRLPSRLLPVRRDLAEGFANAVRMRGLVLERVMGELMELGIATVNEGLSPKELLEAHRSMRVQRKFGISSFPQGLLEEVLKGLPSQELQRLSMEAHGLGGGFEALLRAEGEGDPKESLVRALKHGLFGIEDVSLSEPEPGRVKVRCLALSHGREAMELAAAFIEGFYEALGYGTVRKECMKGALMLEFSDRRLDGGAHRGSLL